MEPTLQQINKAIVLAELNHAECITEEYVKGKFSWICAQGHVFQASYSQMKQNFQCKYCNKQEKNQKKLVKAHELARKEKGKCLSETYPDNSNRLLWECSEGHVWPASFFSVQSGSWCRVCKCNAVGGRKRKTVEDAQHLASLKNGKFLSETYVNVKTKYKWECSKGHVWSATYNDIQKNHWCPYCRKHSLEDAEALAKRKNGKLLSTVYRNCTEKLIWECKEGHQWPASFSSVQNGSWCPHCAGNAKHTLAQMQEIAKERGGTCLSDTYKGANHPLVWKCSEGHVWSTKIGVILRGSWCGVCSSNRRKKSIEDAQKLAEQRQGLCLSKVYIDSHSPLEWKCSEGHVWPAPYERIRSGSWCPTCAREKTKTNILKGRKPRKTIEDAQALALKKNGLCLSVVYVNSYAKLEWECADKHRWPAAYNDIRKGHWCPVCAREKKRKQFK